MGLYRDTCYYENNPLINYGNFVRKCIADGYTTVQRGDGPWVNGFTVKFIAACRHKNGSILAWQTVRFRDDQTGWKIDSYPYGLLFKTEADFEAYCRERQMVLAETMSIADEIALMEGKVSA